MDISDEGRLGVLPHQTRLSRPSEGNKCTRLRSQDSHREWTSDDDMEKDEVGDSQSIDELRAAYLHAFESEFRVSQS